MDARPPDPPDPSPWFDRELLHALQQANHTLAEQATAIAVLTHQVHELNSSVLRIDPRQRTRAEWVRWGLGLLSVPLLALFIWFARGWQQSRDDFERWRFELQQKAITMEHEQRALDAEQTKRIEALERARGQE